MLWLLSSVAFGQLGQQFFGMHVHRGEHFPDRPPFGSIRLWDSGVCWYQLEPRNNYWNFDELDRRVEQAIAEGLHITYVLGQTPTWASQNPADTLSPYCHGCNYGPRNMDDWVDYVWTVAVRYKGRINAYELWNEPNYNIFFNQTPDTLARMVRSAYHTIQSIDPKATIVSPGIIANHWPWQNYSGSEWLRRYFGRCNGAAYCHVVGLHLYTYDTASLEQELLPLLDSVQNTLRELKLDHLPIWDTETGYGNTEAANASKVLYLRGDTAMAYVARAHLLRWLRGVDRFYWYAWDNLGWVGLYMVEPDYVTPTPGQQAYRILTQWLQGASKPRAMYKQGLWTLTYTMYGTYWHIVWCEKGERSLALPREWHITQMNTLDGKNIRLESNEVQVGIVPVLLRP